LQREMLELVVEDAGDGGVRRELDRGISNPAPARCRCTFAVVSIASGDGRRA